MRKLISTALGAALLLVATAAVPGPEVPHFALSKSSPEAGATVASPGEVRLWFTEEPQDGTVQIRLVGADEAGVHVMDVAQDGDDVTSFFIELHGTLPPATYTVSWRGMGDDGHVVRDAFEFTVAAQ